MSSKKTIPFELTDDERSVSIDRERLKKAEKLKERDKTSDLKANKVVINRLRSVFKSD